MKTLLAVGFAVLLGACGCGGIKSTPTDLSLVVPAPLVVKGANLVTAYGDSTQRGFADLNPASVAQGYLGTSATIHQEGVGGSGAYHLAMGMERELPIPVHTGTFSEVAAASNANVMTFRFAINDTKMYAPSDFYNFMESLIVTAQAGGVRRVIVETPNPVSVEPHKTLLPPLVSVLRELAVKHGAVLCDHYALAFANGIEGETLDGIHPNATAYAFEGKTLAECVTQALAP